MGSDSMPITSSMTLVRSPACVCADIPARAAKRSGSTRRHRREDLPCNIPLPEKTTESLLHWVLPRTAHGCDHHSISERERDRTKDRPWSLALDPQVVPCSISLGSGSRRVDDTEGEGNLNRAPEASTSKEIGRQARGTESLGQQRVSEVSRERERKRASWDPGTCVCFLQRRR